MSATVIYGFFITYEKASEMFPGFELDEDEARFEDPQRMVRESTKLTEGICMMYPDFSFASTDDSVKRDTFTVMVGVQTRHVTFQYSAPIRLSEVTERQKVLLDQFVAANPAYKGLEREMLIHVSK